MSIQLLNNIGKETTKGAMIHNLAAAHSGANSTAVLAFSGSAAHQETFTISDDVYELLTITKDTSVITANDELNNLFKTNIVTLTGVMVGDILEVAGEYMQVTEVNPTTVRVSRGYAGSTIAVHADGITINTNTDTGAVGAITVPITATLTPAGVIPLIVKTVNSGLGKLPVTAVKASGDSVIFSKVAADGDVTTSTDIANAAIGTKFTTGVQPASTISSKVMIIATAADVTATLIYVSLPYTPTLVTVAVYTSAGVVKAWDGAATIAGNIVEIDNSGTTDWASTDILILKAFK